MHILDYMVVRMLKKRLRVYRAVGYARSDSVIDKEPIPERTIEYDEEPLMGADDIV